MNDMIPSPDASPLELAGAFGITDPNVLRLLEMMGAQDAEDDEPDNSNQVETIDRLQYDKVLRENLELLKENKYLIRQVETLAAALGACPCCWGEDDQCDGCQGRGMPGAFSPDKEAFADFVLPALRRMQTRQVRKRDQRSNKSIPSKHNQNGKPNLKAD